MLNKSETDEHLHSIQYCFPHINSSCIKDFQPDARNIILYIFISGISLLTVFLNLLVIISISHFKQLHTPTNLLILSLAVADMLVGLIVMPVQGIELIDSCWYFGDTFCKIFPYLLYVVVTASLGNLVFISVDRYVAVNDPLRYPTRVTNNITVFFILITWLSSFLFCIIILNQATPKKDKSQVCYGDCRFAIKFEYFIMDLIFTFIGPCSVILSLYLKIFYIAKKQAQNLNSAKDKKACLNDKAARTIGIVVIVYLLTYIPYYIAALILPKESNENVINIMYWIACLNSCMNPIIYAMFYRWFRITVKHILTLRICEPLSEYFNLLPDNEV
ncbi:trace amine-associated receptor 13c-like [Triplophysa dalaica]|uniref:trace amine-associated receptor 13c-like n=1 Tax=Triplophysa dalaica TaxID=1582913 RepID=UPI0024DF7BF8|nr:trace amine-associated receptor 13c-like [Triplophysa dalaica]